MGSGEGIGRRSLQGVIKIRLSDEELLEAYNTAIELQLEPEFIMILKQEILDRGLVLESE
jgi:hypothetical protein